MLHQVMFFNVAGRISHPFCHVDSCVSSGGVKWGVGNWLEKGEGVSNRIQCI